MRSLFKSERAQSLVEFALVLPVFLVLVLGAVDFGWALRAQITATNSAREGARVGAIGENTVNITAKAVDTSARLLTASNISVVGAQGASGTSVTVSVSYDYNYITPLGGIFSMLSGGTLPSPLPLSASSTMRIE